MAKKLITKELTEETAAKVAEALEVRKRAKTDKMYLAQQLGYDQFQPDVHTDLFNQLLQITPGKPLTEQSKVKNRMILWPRSHYKTTAIVVEVIQLILNYPDIRILLMQGSIKNTKGLLRQIRDHFVGFDSFLGKYFPEFCSEKKFGTAESFIIPARVDKTKKEATVTVASPRSIKAGQHYDVMFFDDVINEQNSKKPAQVEKAIEDFQLCYPLLDGPEYYRYVTGTRYIFDDLYEWIIKNNRNNEWTISIKTAWDEKDHSKLLFPRRTLPNGKTIGFTQELLEVQFRTSPEMFAAHYLNRPIATSKQVFTEEVMLAAVTNDLPKALGPKVMVLDLSLGGDTEKKNDDSVILIGQRDILGKVYVTAGWGDTVQIPAFTIKILELVIKHRPVKILYEDSPAGKGFVPYLRLCASLKKIQLPLEPIKVDTQDGAKRVRVQIAGGVVSQGKCLFVPELECWEKLYDQCIGFPNKKHDDYPDTLALLIQYFNQNATNPIVVTPTIRQISYTWAPIQQETAEVPQPASPDPIKSQFGTLGGFWE
jgi:phage terminase large subunit-like protein